MAHLYDKQVRWKQINQLKVRSPLAVMNRCFCAWKEDTLTVSVGGTQTEVERKREALEAERQLTFTPQLCAKPLKQFDGSARRLAEEGKDRHVQRQMKARQQREQDAQR